MREIAIDEVLLDVDAEPEYFKLVALLRTSRARSVRLPYLEGKMNVSTGKIKEMLEQLERWGVLTAHVSDDRVLFDFLLAPASSNTLFPVAVDPVPLIVELYHTYCPSCRKVRKITPKRRKIIRARWREYPDRDFWIEFFKRVEKSDFLTGRTGQFKADLQWLLTNENFVKVLEGRYDNPQKEEKKEVDKLLKALKG